MTPLASRRFTRYAWIDFTFGALNLLIAATPPQGYAARFAAVCSIAFFAHSLLNRRRAAMFRRMEAELEKLEADLAARLGNVPPAPPPDAP